MGGVHGKRSGAINFKTGEVTVDNVASSVPGRPASIDTIGPVSTIADIFAKQGLTFDNSENSKHSLSLFYVERGGHESNLSMKFNLPTVAEHEPDPDPGNNTSTVTGSETQNNQVKAKQTSSEGNKEKALPKTADISNFGVLAGLGALAILGGFGVYAARKKLGRK